MRFKQYGRIEQNCFGRLCFSDPRDLIFDNFTDFGMNDGFEAGPRIAVPGRWAKHQPPQCRSIHIVFFVENRLAERVANYCFDVGIFKDLVPCLVAVDK